MSVEQAIEIKEELETIDRLIQQLREAAKNAKLYVINMEEMARFAEEGNPPQRQRFPLIGNDSGDVPSAAATAG